MDVFEQLTTEEIDILLNECNDQIGQLSAKLTLLILERDSVRKKLLAWKNEREILEILKSGEIFSENLTDVQHNTIRTLQKKYNILAKKYNKFIIENSSEGK